MPVPAIKFALQRAERAIQQLTQDPNSIEAVVAIGSSIPEQREALVRQRLVDHDVVPLNNANLRKAIVVPSVLCAAAAGAATTTKESPGALYDVIISIDTGFDMRALSRLTNEALMTLRQYQELRENISVEYLRAM